MRLSDNLENMRRAFFRIEFQVGIRAFPEVFFRRVGELIDEAEAAFVGEAEVLGREVEGADLFVLPVHIDHDDEAVGLVEVLLQIGDDVRVVAGDEVHVEPMQSSQAGVRRLRLQQ